MKTDAGRTGLAMAGALLAALTVSACGEHPAATPDRPNTQTTVPATPPPQRNNVGTGLLRNTRFAVAPAVSVYPCPRPVRHPRPRSHDCSFASYVVFARLTRDVPRRPSGMIAARFDVDGLSDGDPIGRASKPDFCFEQGLGTTGYQAVGVPTEPGARVTLTLTAFDRRGKPNGELATSVRLRRGERRRSAHDHSPPPDEQEAIGC
jgi:hypothetical protein